MKHIYRYLLLFTVYLLLIVPYTISAQEGESYYEGIDVFHVEKNDTTFVTVMIQAVKHVNGSWRESEVFLAGEFGRNPLGLPGVTIITTFTVPEDADWLEVSEDLGWGGLDAEVWVPAQVTRCPDGHCTTTTESVLVTIHLSAFADHPVTHNGTEYSRYSRFSGTVTVGPHSLTYNRASGYTFSDQYSEEDWP